MTAGFDKWFKVVATVALLILTVNLCFTNLAKTISASDESIHVSVVQGMYHSGNWFSPAYEGQPYFRKPPFKMWLSALSLHFLGESNTAYRVIDATLGVGMVFLVLGFGVLFLKSFWVGYLGAFFLLYNRAFLVSSHGYRHGTQDPMLHFLQCIAMILFFLWFERFSCQREKSQLRLAGLYGLTIGLSILTKNVLGFIAPGLAFVYLCLVRQILPFTLQYKREICLALFLAFLIPGLYMVPHFIWTPGAFDHLFLSEVVNRVSVGVHNTDRYWYYFEKFYRWEFLPIPQLIAGIIYGLYAVCKEKNERMLFLLVWATVPILVFSFMPSRLLWYIAESYPALCLLSASAIVFLLKKIRTYYRYPMPCIVILAALLLLVKPWYEYGPRLWRKAHRIDSRAQMDRIIDVLLKFPDARLLVYGPAFQWQVPYKSRIEKHYLRRFKERLTIVHSLPVLIEHSAHPIYDFMIAPGEELHRVRRQFRPHSFFRLFPFQHRNEKVFLLSRVDTGSGLFSPSSPISDG